MPLEKGTSKEATEANFHEVRHGNTYAKTKKKFGKQRANKQMVAIVLSNKRKSAKRKRGGKR
jgi:hypothetical protein